MSKGLTDTLNMKSLDEILAETEAAEEAQNKELVEVDENEEDLPVPTDESGLMRHDEMTNASFAKDMDEIYEKAMEIADSAADLANNIDPARAPRMFEVAGQQLKIALDASHSKRDAQLRLMKLIQEQRKLELEELKVKTELGDESAMKGEVVMVEDRNKLLAQIRSMKKKPDA